ncbi:LON peptidase substrate-binding domain-containing protein [Haloferula rosea]|uniref:LON peptidase substrate-binding domain-containing protein n=1 Tax=Haloferula rosea TaxID=490093 RepID=A0A934VA47_9BACT|nr:LON peptidase substrate-binding domain-containing protein [Haloferula rosea]MBK1825918.1 LON peptidase substrate-binding domain-containing protein [Haloferula rosea]
MSSSLVLPEVSGVMLLPECTLFPHGGLPLHIFEPRYREMLADSLETTCFFCVARLEGEETDDPATCTSSIGTVGLVRASREMDDGSSNLLLHGVIRVRFNEWINDASYPKARISPLPAVFEPETQSEAAIEALKEAAESALGEFSTEIGDAFYSMTESIDDPAILADVMAQQFIQNPTERHDLLEMESVAERIAWLCSHLSK